jgi:hypothetical protein
MTQGTVGYNILSNKIGFADTGALDAFSRLRVSQPSTLFESTFNYDLQPLLYEQITSNGSIAHDASNSCADLSISANTGLAALQSYQWIRYQPGKSQIVLLTFTFGSASTNVTRRIGLFSATNSGATVTIADGIFLEQTASAVNLRIVNSGTRDDQTVAQGGWNLDTLNGTGASGITLDLSKSQILVIDFQWLGVGRVRMGFDIDGEIIYAHEFLNANVATDVYMRTATLPIRAELTTSAAASATMSFICSSVVSEGGVDNVLGYSFASGNTVTAGNGTRTHIMSIQPKLTFNGTVNRSRFALDSVEVVVTGNSPVLWELCIGQALTGGSFGDVNATYSGMQVDTTASLSGNPSIVMQSGYVAASATARSSVGRDISVLYPVTLDAAGAIRALGRITGLVTGLGGTSAVYMTLNWKEVR